MAQDADNDQKWQTEHEREIGEDELLAANRLGRPGDDELTEGSARFALGQWDLISARGGKPRAWYSKQHGYRVMEEPR